MSRHLRTWLVLATLSTVASAVVVPAMAADQTVKATTSNSWSPSTVTVDAGDRVHFANSNGGTHDLRFNGEAKSVTPLSSSWTYDRTFPTAGTYAFYCTVHPKMTGSVVVAQATTTAPAGTTTTAPAGTTTTTSTAIASFAASPRRLRVSRTARFRYPFLASPSSSGKISLKSTRKVKIGSQTRVLKLAAKAFTASPTATATVRFKLSSASLKALKHLQRLRFVVTATVGGRTFTTKLTLRAPRRT